MRQLLAQAETLVNMTQWVKDRDAAFLLLGPQPNQGRTSYALPGRSEHFLHVNHNGHPGHFIPEFLRYACRHMEGQNARGQPLSLDDARNVVWDKLVCAYRSGLSYLINQMFELNTKLSKEQRKLLRREHGDREDVSNWTWKAIVEWMREHEAKCEKRRRRKPSVGAQVPSKSVRSVGVVASVWASS